MANWSNPQLTSTYTNFLSEVKDRDVDLALQFDGTTSTNLTVGTIRWDSTANRWKKWSGSAWGELATTYALTGLSTTGNANIGGTLSVTGTTALAAATATTPATGDNNTNVATTAFVKAQGYATLASPTLTGTPAGPTATAGSNTTQLATTAFVNAEIANDALLLSGGTLSGALTLAGDPSADLHAVPRRWVQSLAPKQSCRVATTANITLSGTQTIDGIALSIGDRVLVKDQSTTNQNGIYVVASGAWTRATDADSWDDLVGAYTTVEQGTVGDDTFWMCEIARGGTLGTTAITWQLVSSPQLAAIGTLATNGLLARTGAGNFDARSIAVSGTGLSVSNADGVSGNPTITSNATSANTASAIVARDGSGNFSAGTITAALSGNASTANTLATARNINGTSFNGSASITTATWGTSRTLTIGSANKSVDGSANVSWSLSEIGAPEIVLSTAVATTSGTAIDFTSIPSWVKRITVMLRGVTTNGSSIPIIQLGTSGGIDATGYTGDTLDYNTSAASGSGYTNVSGIRFRNSVSSASVFTGFIVLVTQTTNVWVSNGQISAGGTSGASAVIFNKSLSSTLDRLRLTTVNGLSLFTAGSINILYEG